jgi:hypothetical protein
MVADVLHPAEHRSYRELAAVVRQMLEHWAQLGRWLPANQGAAEMTAGADVARRLLADFETQLQRYKQLMVTELTGGLRAPRPDIGRPRVGTQRQGHALSSDSQFVVLVIAREASDRRRRIGQKLSAFAPPRRSASASPRWPASLPIQPVIG